MFSLQIENLKRTVPKSRTVLLLLGASVFAMPATQTRGEGVEHAYKAPRNVYGQPDFAGTWENNFVAILERPAKYGSHNVLPAEEAAKIMAELNKRRSDRDKPLGPNAPAAGGGLDVPYGNTAWANERKRLMTVNGEVRISIITDPVDGRLPPLTPVAVAREERVKVTIPDTYDYGGQPAPPGLGENDNPESRSLAERCLASFGNKGGPVLMGGSWGRDRDDRLRGNYNSNYVVGQSRDTMAIVTEMPHDLRIIRVGGKHPPAAVRYWQGDSIGRWEGDTLVVETTNYRLEQTDFFGSLMRNLKITERFTRVGSDRLRYQFHVSDPDTWVTSWGGEYEFMRSKGELYEYACAEGNYSLHDILQGQRALDMAKAQQVGKPAAQH